MQRKKGWIFWVLVLMIGGMLIAGSPRCRLPLQQVH